MFGCVVAAQKLSKSVSALPCVLTLSVIALSSCVARAVRLAAVFPYVTFENVVADDRWMLPLGEDGREGVFTC